MLAFQSLRKNYKSYVHSFILFHISNTFHTPAQLHQRQTWVKRIRQQEKRYKIVVQTRQQQYANLLGLETPKASNFPQTLLKYTYLRGKCLVLHTLLNINIKSLSFCSLFHSLLFYLVYLYFHYLLPNVAYHIHHLRLQLLRLLLFLF